MCLRCQGHGALYELNMERLLPTPQTTLRQMLGHAGCQTTFNYLLKGMLKEYADRPFAEAPENVRRNFLYGIPVGDGRLSHNLSSHLRWKFYERARGARLPQLPRLPRMRRRPGQRRGAPGDPGRAAYRPTEPP